MENEAVIFIKKDEEIESLLRKLDASRSKKVVFNFPENSKIFGIKNSLKIICEEAENLGKEIFIETADEKGIRACQSLGVGFSDLREGKKEEIQLLQKNEANEPSPEHLEIWFKNGKKNGENREPREQKYHLLRPITNHLFLLLFIASFSIFALTLFFILPKADIKIKSREEVIEENLKIKAQKDQLEVNKESLIISAVVFSEEASGKAEFDATGKKQAEERAKGKIEVFNAYSSKSQVLVATTRFQSKDGKIFRSIKAVTVPGAKQEGLKLIPSSILIDVAADKTGEAYNIGPSDFTIPGFLGSPRYDGFYGKSFEPMKGGASGQASFATAEDIQKAAESLKQNLGEKAKTALKSKITSPLHWLSEAVDVLILESSATKEGAIGEKGEVSMKIAVKLIVFNQENLDFLIEEKLKTRVKNSERLIDSEKELAFSDITKNFAKGILTFSVNAKARKVKLVDLAQLKEELKGKKESSLNSYLSSKSDILASVSVDFWPFWVNSIPRFSKSINITIEP